MVLLMIVVLGIIDCVNSWSACYADAEHIIKDWGDMGVQLRFPIDISGDRVQEICACNGYRLQGPIGKTYYVPSRPPTADGCNTDYMWVSGKRKESSRGQSYDTCKNVWGSSLTGYGTSYSECDDHEYSCVICGEEMDMACQVTVYQHTNQGGTSYGPFGSGSYDMDPYYKWLIKNDDISSFTLNGANCEVMFFQHSGFGGSYWLYSSSQSSVTGNDKFSSMIIRHSNCYDHYYDEWPNCDRSGNSFSGLSTVTEAKNACNADDNCFAFSFANDGSGEYKDRRYCKSSGKGTGSSHDSYCKCGECHFMETVVPVSGVSYNNYNKMRWLMVSGIILVGLNMVCLIVKMRKKTYQKY